MSTFSIVPISSISKKNLGLRSWISGLAISNASCGFLTILFVEILYFFSFASVFNLSFSFVRPVVIDQMDLPGS